MPKLVWRVKLVLERREPNPDAGGLGSVAQHCENPAYFLPSVIRVVELVEARQRFSLSHRVIEDVREIDTVVP